MVAPDLAGLKLARELQAEIEIQASPETVWRVLTDFERYPEWSRFLVSVRGRAEAITRLEVCIETGAGRHYRFRPLVLQVTPPRSFRWLGRVGVPGLFDGEHGFFLDALPEGGTRLRQQERFQGFLVPLLWRRIAPGTLAGFRAFNAALKQRAEVA